MRCPTCYHDHVEILKRKLATGGHFAKDYNHVSGEVKQCWLKCLCHRCHFVWSTHFLYGRKEIIAMLEDGGKIRAIKMYRLATGEGLYESKKVVDEIADEIGYVYSTPALMGVATSKSKSEENIT